MNFEVMPGRFSMIQYRTLNCTQLCLILDLVSSSCPSVLKSNNTCSQFQYVSEQSQPSYCKDYILRIPPAIADFAMSVLLWEQ